MNEHKETLNQPTVEQNMTQSLIEQRNPDERQKPYGVYFLEPPDPAIELAEELELDEFDRVFGNGPEVMAREYGPYRAASKFVLVLDHENSLPAGVLRIIVNSPVGLKSLNDLQRAPWSAPIEQVLADSRIPGFNLESTWDIATIAVASGYQGAGSIGKVSTALLRATLGLAKNRDVKHIVAIIDDEVLRLRFDRLSKPSPFNRFVGVEPRPYIDSPSSTPVYADLAEMEQRALQTSPRTHARYFEGQGMDDISFPEELEAPQ